MNASMLKEDGDGHAFFPFEGEMGLSKRKREV